MEVLRLVLQRTSTDRKTIPTLLGTPMSITARAGGLFESVSTHLFLPAAHWNERTASQEALRNKCSYWVRLSLEEGDGERPQPRTNAGF